MKMKDLEKDSVRRLKIDDGADSQRLDNFLMARLKGVPKSRIYKLVRGGEVRVNGGRVEVSYRLKLGDEVRIPPVRMAAPAQPAAPKLPPSVNRLLPHVLYRDEALIALDKPSGMAVHGGSGVSRGVIEQLRLELPECRYLELVHRLDRETSGVLLVALKRRALTGLHAAMREGRIEKRYLTLVAGRWPNPVQHVKLPLHKRVTDEGEKRVTVRDEGQAAHTIFRRLQQFADFSLLEAELKTGRTHQIRVHTSHLGFPIAGDDKYGDFELNRRLMKQGLKRMFLHAAKLVFDHPITGERLTIEAPLPADLAAFLETLNAQAI
ncbi:RluA family pseudouridine synthase [Thiobacillus sedimenti]|uniref:Pseudouridine synthase n=1 Tax=Thiobacillus sedimenti TaxID=3110231 RepID=A0ABZ1CM04_9PROT|nr:RluA family pseudouridine synthase [Thiobacillus sp. SCUT-2]WRS40312.1 RluA family pseudouridine synthase [Thiobacillus sp. SCUT-2]